MWRNNLRNVIWIIGIGLILQASSLFGTDTSGDILSDQSGTLSWGGSPAVDGSGMTFTIKIKRMECRAQRRIMQIIFPETKTKSKL